MHKYLSAYIIVVALSPCFPGVFAIAQTRSKAATQDVSAQAERAVGLAEKGRCKEAVAVLKKITSQLTDKPLKYAAAMATARCGMSLDQTETAVQALLLLQREFPHDPDVLYMTTHFYGGAGIAGFAGISGDCSRLSTGWAA